MSISTISGRFRLPVLALGVLGAVHGASLAADAPSMKDADGTPAQDVEAAVEKEAVAVLRGGGDLFQPVVPDNGATAVWRDRETGCQYIVGKSGAVPRWRGTGGQVVGCRANASEAELERERQAVAAEIEAGENRAVACAQLRLVEAAMIHRARTALFSPAEGRSFMRHAAGALCEDA